MTNQSSGITTRRRLDEILRSVSRLRPLPGNSTRILKALEDQNSTAGVIAGYISLDQALTAYILRVSNSAAMGYLLACSSIKDAVIRLGFKQVRSLVYSTVASGPLSSRLSGYRLGDKELWYHSVAVASAAHWLAGALRYPDPEKAYVAGLLHDIGKLVLDQYVLADYNQMVQIMLTQQIPMWQVEEHMYGIDHAGVGGIAGEHWQFPTELTDAIRFHHSPSIERPDQRLAALVNLANALIPNENESENAFLEGRVVHPQTFVILKINPEFITQLQERLTQGLFAYQDRLNAG